MERINKDRTKAEAVLNQMQRLEKRKEQRLAKRKLKKRKLPQRVYPLAIIRMKD